MIHPEHTPLLFQHRGYTGAAWPESPGSRDWHGRVFLDCDVVTFEGEERCRRCRHLIGAGDSPDVAERPLQGGESSPSN